LTKLLQLAGILVLGLGTAQAGAISSLADPALAGGTLVDLSGQAVNTYTSLTVGALTFSAFGNSGNFSITNFLDGQFNMTGNSIDNDSGLGYGIKIQFATPVSAIGFHYGGLDDTFTVSAYSDASSTLLIESDTFVMNDAANQGNDGKVAGISSSSSNIYSLLITPHPGDWSFYSDFTYASGASTSAPTPEPAGWMMLAAAMGVLVMMRRFHPRLATVATSDRR
jgi:hypothetical protein